MGIEISEVPNRKSVITVTLSSLTTPVTRRHLLPCQLYQGPRPLDLVPNRVHRCTPISTPATPMRARPSTMRRHRIATRSAIEPPREGRGVDGATAGRLGNPIPAVEDAIEGKLVLGVEELTTRRVELRDH
jgi:hypothetical protein